jgi:hypothetical protein
MNNTAGYGHHGFRAPWVTFIRISDITIKSTIL